MNPQPFIRTPHAASAFAQASADKRSTAHGPTRRREARGNAALPSVKREAGREAAFTITELLAAFAILAVLSTILLSALNQVTKVTSLAQGKTATYQETRTVMEQMSRELQQAIPYTPSSSPAGYASFIALTNQYSNSSHLHFIAMIDNNKGQEEVEVHYVYDGTNSLYKSVIPYDGGPPTGNWDIYTPIDWWQKTPFSMATAGVSPINTPTTNYTSILEGVKSFSFEVWTNAIPIPPIPFPPNSTNSDSGGYIESKQWTTNFPPSYLKVALEVYDPQVIRRWGSATNASLHEPHLVRPFHILVCLPRGCE